MPGNGTPGSIRNFFEQDNSFQDRPSQVGGGGWPILNNNPWVSTQRQNGAPLAFNSKNFTDQLSDSEQGNCMQPVQTPFGLNSSQKVELIRNQPRNQHLNLNGYMHASQGLQARSVQAEFQGNGIVSNGHNLMQRGFSTVESQQISAHGYNSSATRSSERPEATEAHVNFDFLGGQQQITSQHPGIIQPRQIQPIRVSDMQLWQQHLLYQQLKEMRRQQQSLQLQQGARQQNSFSQQSDVGRQASRDQIPADPSGMPINNAYNNMWSNELVGGETKLPSSSPMFLSENMNFARRSSVQGIPKGLMFPHDQGQGIGSMMLAPQQPNQSLYGTPVASTRGSVSHQSQFQGMQGSPHNYSSTQETIPNQAGDTPMQSSAFNYFQSDQSAVRGECYLHDSVSFAEPGFQGKNMLESASMQGVRISATSENFQQANHVSPSVQVQEMSGMLPENSEEQVGPAHGVANLDPNEEKLLFRTDNDGNQDVSYGVSNDRRMGGYLEGNLVQNSDYFGSTLHSGSWSALMQEAVESSSSDTGLNEEWSGLSFQKTELSSGNHSAMLQDNNVKKQVNWGGQNLENAPHLTSRPIPLFNDGNASLNSHTQPNFLRSMNMTGELTSDAFHVSIQHSSKEVEKPFDEKHQQKQPAGSSIHSQTHFNNALTGVWDEQTCERPATSIRSSEVEFSSHNMQHSLDHQQKTSLYSYSGNRLNGPGSQSLAHTRSDTSNYYGNGDNRPHDQGDDMKRTMSMETDHDGNMWKVAGTRVGPSFSISASRKATVGSDTYSLATTSNNDTQTGNLDAVVNSNNLNLNQETNQHMLSRHRADYGNHVAVDAFFQDKKEETTAKYQNQMTGVSQPWDSSMRNTERRPGESCTHKQENSQQEDGLREGFISSNTQPDQNTEGGSSAGENSLLAGNDCQSLVNSLKPSGQSGHKNMVPPMFQFHPMGNFEMSTEPVDSKGQIIYSQGYSHSAAQALKKEECGYVGHLQFTGLNNALEMGKGHMSDIHGNGIAAEEIQHICAFSSHSATPALDGSTSQFSENKRTTSTSQNMLELLHKVDQPRVGKAVEHFGFSDQNAACGRLEVDTFDGSSHLQPCLSPSFRGFGLKLAPPTQRQSVSDHALPLQTSLEAANDFSRRSFDSGASQDQSRPPSSTSVQSLPPHCTSQKENQADKSFQSSGDINKGVLYPNFQGNPLAETAYALSMNRSPLQTQQQQKQQEQQQCISPATTPAVNDESDHLQQVGVDANNSSQPVNREESQDVGTPEQSSDASMPSAAERLTPSRFTSHSDTRVSSTSQFNHENASHSQDRIASSRPRSSCQESHVVETRSVGHTATKSAVSQQGGFSTMLHNVWTSVSSQQRLSGIHPQKIISNVLQSKSHLPSGSESSQAPLKPDNQNKRKGESAPSEFGTCSATSKQFVYGEDCFVKDNISEQMPPPNSVDVNPMAGSALQGSFVEPDLKHHSDGSTAVSISSSARLSQQYHSKGTHAHDSSTDVNKGHVSVSSIASSNRDTGAYGQHLESSGVQKRNNYSLLHQIHAMKSADSDPNRRPEKRLKGVEFGVDASQMDWVVGHRYNYGQKTVLRETDATPPNTSIPSDIKMLNFSSRNIKENSSNTHLQVIGTEVSPQEPPTYKQRDLQNHSHPHGKNSIGHFAEGSERPPISPHMAPSWFEKYGNHKNGQALTTYGGSGSSQSNTKASGQNYVSSKVPESMVQHIVPEQKDHTNVADSLGQSTLPATILPNNSVPSSGHSPQVTENNMLLIPKKRKSPMSDLLPWHKEVTQGRRRLQSISIMDQKWAWATNRLTEKLEDEFEMIEDALSITRLRRRLVLTTQLMQQILPPVPSRYLREDASTSYGSFMYFMAKLIIGDACSVMCCLESHSRAVLDGENMTSGVLNVSEKEGDNRVSKVVEDFIGRSKKLENDFFRLDKMASLLDVRLECQELERHSIMNRFAKFHSRAASEGVVCYPTTETATRRSFLHRHVTAHALPRDLPEGVTCLSI